MIQPGLYPAICFRGEYETVRGDDRVAEGHESRREAPSAGGVWGVGVPLPGDGGPPPQGWGSGGITPGKILKLETQFGAILCILARN